MTLQNDVAILIDEEGKAGTLRKVTEGVYNTATGSVSSTTADTSVMLMLLNYSDYQRQNELIQSGDRKALIKSKGLTVIPEIQDILIAGGQEHTIIDVRQIEQSGTDVVYICQVRR